MKIDIGHVLTNAIATLVAAVFVGAMAIVWQGATSVGDEVAKATADIRSANEQTQKTNADIQRTNNSILQQQVTMEATHETLIEEIAGLQADLEAFRADHQSVVETMSEWQTLIDAKGALRILAPSRTDRGKVQTDQTTRIRGRVREKGQKLIQQIQQQQRGN